MTIKTIYEFLPEYSKEAVDEAVHSLSNDEKMVLYARYGNDLSNPETQVGWDKEKRDKLYGTIIPRIKRILKNNASKNITLEKKSNVTKKVSDIVERKIEKKDEPKTNIVTPDSFSYEQILSLIRAGKSNKEMCETLNISTKCLYEQLLRLENFGIKENRKYYSDGSIKYSQIFSVKALKDFDKLKAMDKTIITAPDEDNMKFLLISDPHFGNSCERLDLLDDAFNYCKKNNINIIFCTGDFIDGNRTQGTQNISDVYKQVEYFLKNYPCDKDILTFGVCGDHDLDALRYYNVDLMEACYKNRHDIIIGGYNNAYVNIKNDKIHLYHRIENGKIIYDNAPIVLHGHSHKFSILNLKDYKNISLPSICDINQELPAFLELDVTFKNGLITNFVIKHICPALKDATISESTYDIASSRIYTDKNIANVEAYKTKTLQK